MSISASLLPEYDHEMIGARATLERIPESKFDWKPHPKSFSFGSLATHVADIPGWAKESLLKDELDLAPPGAPPYKREPVTTVRELLERFDKNVVAGRAAIEGTPDAEYFKNWSLLNGGKVVLTMPKIAVVRGFVLSHLIHHRAQLGLYLRLNDVPVPSIYGPSADEGKM